MNPILKITILFCVTVLITIVILLLLFHLNNKCKNNKCSGNGTCVKLTGKCDCKEGFTGDDCSITIDKCVNNKCSGNGTCVKLTGKCDCKEGFTGDDCSITIDKCVNNKCSGNGTCVKLTGKCDCKEGFTGDDCSKIQYKIGDSVNTTDDTTGNINGCVTNVNNNMVDICYGVVNNGYCQQSLHTSIDSIQKIDNIQLQCSNTNAEYCKNEPNACLTTESYPSNTYFDEKQDCIDYFGTSNFGSCIQHTYPYTGDKWTIGCKEDTDCPGGNRKCITDGNPLNQLGKACSCLDNKDCIFGKPPNNYSPSCLTSSTFGYGTLSCSDINKI